MNKKDKNKNVKNVKEEDVTMDYTNMDAMMDMEYDPNIDMYPMGYNPNMGMYPNMMNMNYPMMEEDMVSPETMNYPMDMCMAPYMGMCPYMMGMPYPMNPMGNPMMNMNYPMMEENMMDPSMMMNNPMAMPYQMNMEEPMMLDEDMYDKDYLEYMCNMYRYMANIYAAEANKLDAMKCMKNMKEE